MNGGVILLYHRVIELPTDPQLLCVSRARFADHLRTLKRVASPMSIAQMLDLAAADGLPERAVAVTFDDGYWDNFAYAAPMLARAEVPATVFATTAHTDTHREFFWDDLERVFLRPNTLPQQLELRVGEHDFAAHLQYTATYAVEAFAQDCHWDITMPTAPSPRQAIYRDLCGLLYKATVAQRESALTTLQAWSGLGPIGRESHRMATSRELDAATTNPWLEIAAHTAEHARLASESAAGQATLIGRGHGGFSYPFGTRHDYTATTVDLVKAAGYRYACSNFNGLVNAATDPFQLPRFIVRDWEGSVFERHLDNFFAWQPRARVSTVAS